MRRHACLLVRPKTEGVAIVSELLEDLNVSVRTGAACTLGRLGHDKALPVLLGLLANNPSSKIINAISSVMDENAAVLLGRLARGRSEFLQDVLDAFEGSDIPLVEKLSEGLRR